MQLDLHTYQDKVNACWIGKNIGGTMGTPYEGARKVLDIKGFSTPPNSVLPNDDLDLQLVWLYALETVGPREISAKTLGEFWLSFISPHWNEYGIGKANMRRGLVPPMSGDYDNNWRDSNGAWIRTEIWACVAPGVPAFAAKYAMEDAKVDHGAGEGTFAAAFVAAMQSAAFAVKDLRTCIEIGLTAIPESCRIARSVRLVLECYDQGKTWLETRNAVQAQNADLGDGWFEAPSNVGYTILGLIYGEGDFKKSMITAINCGDDTDCTGATVGATLGILYGMNGIPEDWRTYIGDDIVTISTVNSGDIGGRIPRTCTQLTQRVVKLAPTVLYTYNQRNLDRAVELGEGDDIPENVVSLLKEQLGQFYSRTASVLKPWSMHFEEAFLQVDLALSGAPEIAPGGQIGVHIDFTNDTVLENMPHGLSLRWILPDGFDVTGKSAVLLPRYDSHNDGRTACDAVITAGETVQRENRIVLEITVPGRHTALYASFLLFGC